VELWAAIPERRLRVKLIRRRACAARRKSPGTAIPIAHRPFCSLRCRLIDLGVWLDEGYRIESEERPAESPPDVP
jgi:endogenous inhibitor of DNA gyrase (YacG/DUF329 family)